MSKICPKCTQNYLPRHLYNLTIGHYEHHLVIFHNLLKEIEKYLKVLKVHQVHTCTQ